MENFNKEYTQNIQANRRSASPLLLAQDANCRKRTRVFRQFLVS